jgi:hypothetical protein
MELRTNPTNIIEMAVERGINIALSGETEEMSGADKLVHFRDHIMDSLNNVVTFVDYEEEFEED